MREWCAQADSASHDEGEPSRTEPFALLPVEMERLRGASLQIVGGWEPSNGSDGESLKMGGAGRYPAQTTAQLALLCQGTLSGDFLSKL